MKLNLSKKATKRGLSATAEESHNEVDGEEAAKKSKSLNGDPGPVVKPPNALNVSMFQYFKDLTHEDELKRMEAALKLIQQLSKNKEPEKRQKELNYTLKRLVRGCGAATNVSRAGFYTGLVAFLKAFDGNEVGIKEVFDTMQKELHVGANIANKEDADAVVGKILTCGALLQSGRLTDADRDHLEHVTNILLRTAKNRTYHASLAFAFLIELIEKLTEAQFEASVWPLLQKELVHPWPKQTLQSVHCLIVVLRKFPTVVSKKFLKAHFGNVHLVNAESYTQLYKIYWEHNSIQLLTHPAFELFGAYIASSPNLNEFWTQHVDPGLQVHSKLREIITLKVATDVLSNLPPENEANVIVADLLSTNFMRMLVGGLKALKQKKDETLKAFYDDFFEALLECCGKLSADVQRTAVIRRLILHPGIFGIEKYTSTRVVHQLINVLHEEGVKDMFQLYKKIFLGNLTKNFDNAGDTWLNFERLNAGYMLQHLLMHKSVHSAYKWREQQLKFLLTCGIFYVTASAEICKKEVAAAFSKEFGEQCKNMFYTSLQTKLTDMEQEHELLSNLVQFCHEQMQQKHATKQFRIKFDESLQNCWNRMYNAVCTMKNDGNDTRKSKEKANRRNSIAKDKLQLVFHILLLNMGLQLFVEPDMAGPAIDDLLKCMQHAKDKQHKLKEKVKHSVENVEPTWIEVVVDLFLHLLSQNASALRNIVNALFPHLCGNMNLNAVHQILAMLDMKDGHNPLSCKEDEESDEDTEDETNEDKSEEDVNNETDKSNIESEQNESDENDNSDNSEDNDSDSDENDDDDDEDIGEDDDEVSATDKLRNAISQALIESSGGAGADDDMASVDLNDMTEEEGRKLDEALGKAFKSMRKGGSNATQSKKSKSNRVKTTTVMHFRIRVLDLIEIYLQQKPTLLITIEIMLALFDMMQYCVGSELKQLQVKIEKVLQKLTSLKGFTSDPDLTEDNLTDFVRLVVEKKTPAAAFESVNKMRNKCIAFLISSTNNVTNVNTDSEYNNGKVFALWREYIQEFVHSRNPTVNITLLSDLFKLRWRGIWDLAVLLADKGVTLKTRIFRRIQIYEILSVLYKNNELQKLDSCTAKTKLEIIERTLITHIKTLATTSSMIKVDAKTTTNVADKCTKTSSKEFNILLELLLHARKANSRLQVKTALINEEVYSAVQTIRQHICLENAQAYHRYCAVFKLPILRNNNLQSLVPPVKQNGNDESAADENLKQLQKRKQNQQWHKQKKQKKEQRMEASSRGLNGGFGFAQTIASDDNEEILA